MNNSLTNYQLLEVDKCFIWTLEKITVDKIPFRNVLFGSTVANWFKGRSQIVITGNPPDANYKRALPFLAID